MKVLVIHNEYKQRGGEYVCFCAHVALLRKFGHRVITYSHDNAEIESYSLFEKLWFPFNTAYSRETYRELRKIVAEERPDVAHVHNVFPLLSPSVYQALADGGIPIVQTVHNFRFMCPNGLFYTHTQICERCKYGNTLHAVLRRCYRNSFVLSLVYALTIGLHRKRGTFRLIDRYIALTEFGASKLAESGVTTRDRIRVLGNFLPDPLPTLGSETGRLPYVLYLGRVALEKGISVLIEALATHGRLLLKIAGDGPQLQSLQALVHRLGLSSRVEFLGRVTGETKQRLLREATALTLPSVCYENFPVTILESFAVATPVIASDIGSIPYLVKHERNGLLFGPSDSRALGDALLELTTDPSRALEMGRKGRETVDALYTSNVHYNQLMRIYQEIAA